MARQRRGGAPKGSPAALGLTTDARVAQELRRMLTQDAFSNPLARLGYGTPNLLEGTQYPLTRLTNNYQLINSLYRNHWIVRKAVDTIPEDECRNWIRVTSQLKPDMIERLDRSWRKRGLRDAILHGLKWGRLYGGAAGLMLIAGHEQWLDQPLDLDTVLPGALKGVMVVDRWVGAYPSEELIQNPADPEFGLPMYYQVTLTNGEVIRIHHSRILRFVGRRLPYWEQLAEVYWGESEIEIIYEELKKRDNTSWNIAQLIFLANLRVLKMSDLGQILAIGDQQAQQDLYNVVQQQNWLASNMGIQLLSAGDDFEMHQNTFAGLNDIYQSFMMDIAGATQIPVTRLFGRSPAGMDATGEGDLQHYYEVVEEQQETYLRPVLDKILPVLCVSELGAIPDDLDYVFNPVRKPNASEVAELADKKTQLIVDTFNAGIISRKTALQELRQMADDTGVWSNITDEMIAAAEETTQPAGEDVPSGLEGLLGSPSSTGSPVPKGAGAGAPGDRRDGARPREPRRDSAPPAWRI